MVLELDSPFRLNEKIKVEGNVNFSYVCRSHRGDRHYLEQLVLDAIFLNLVCDMYVESSGPIHHY